jgi:pimeloyl-ACP methyl ester carboxylesterase
MAGLNLSQVFCEILSGFALSFSVLPMLDVLQICSFDQIISWIGSLDGAIFVIALVLFYIMGLLIDAVGLAIGESFLDNLLNANPPSKEDRAAFWKNVPAHLLNYHDRQWTYYSAYRSLFILFIPGGISWIWMVWKKWGVHYGFLVGIFFVIIEFALYRTLIALLNLYYDITKSFNTAQAINKAKGKKNFIESYIRLSNEEIIFLRHNKLKKSKKTLLFVHGLGESGLCFEEVFSDPRFNDFNLLVPDMTGYGRSSGASNCDYRFNLQVQRLWQLIEHFNATFDINELVLIGHSLGGDLTTLFCREYLDKKIIKQYINIEGDITPHELFISGQAVEAFERGGFAGFETWLRDEFASKVYDEYARKFGESLQRYYASLRFCRPEAFLRNAQELCLRNRKFPDEKIRSEIGKIYLSISKKIPAVFCYGTESLKPETVRFLEENNVNRKEFEGAGHWLMIDKKEEFYEFLYKYISNS